VIQAKEVALNDSLMDNPVREPGAKPVTTNEMNCEAATSIAHQRAGLFAEKWGQPYPRALDCLLENLTALTAYLHFPAERWERVRHSNLLERTFGAAAGSR